MAKKNNGKKTKRKHKINYFGAACTSRIPASDACLALLNDPTKHDSCRNCQAPEVKKKVERIYRFI